MNKTILLAIAALMGALSVALGAFAAHALQQMVPAASVQIFETGVRYQFYHVFCLVVGCHPHRKNFPISGCTGRAMHLLPVWYYFRVHCMHWRY